MATLNAVRELEAASFEELFDEIKKRCHACVLIAQRAGRKKGDGEVYYCWWEASGILHASGLLEYGRLKLDSEIQGRIVLIDRDPDEE